MITGNALLSEIIWHVLMIFKDDLAGINSMQLHNNFKVLKS